MAAVTDVQLVNIAINDVQLQVPKGEMVIESAKRLGLEIPIFCYHPRMKPVGMCRMCLIECGYKMPDGSVRKMPKPQAACTLPATEGLIVYTDTEALHNDRRGVLEFLLINHPLDCPICDRGGECPLQNNTLFYGPSTSRFVEMKRHAPKAFPLSKYVTLDLERCIQCGRCVRFTEEISGDGQLAFRFRGAKMQPSTFELTDFESKFSGNVIEICPVGALTNSQYRFRARPWDLQTGPGICTICSNGCNVFMDYRAQQIVRIQGRTNEAVNEEWTCDRGKFGHSIFNSEQRLKQPLVRRADKLVPGDWPDAFRDIATALAPVGPSGIACLASGALSNEDYYVLKQFIGGTLGSRNLDHRLMPNPPTARFAGPKTPISDYETAKTVLIFGSSLADEEPILFLRVRKGWLKNKTKVVVAHSEPTDVDGFAAAVLRYRPGSASVLAKGLAGDLGPAEIEAQTGVSASEFAAALKILEGTSPFIATTRALYAQPDADPAVSALEAFASKCGSTLNIYSIEANGQGASELGIVPTGEGMDTREILHGCASGQIKFLWLAGVDPFEKIHDHDLIQRALEGVDFLVFQHWQETEAISYASVVLPMTAPFEAEGTYTNLERRVQLQRRVIPAHGSAKPPWRTFEELNLRLNAHTPIFSAREVFRRIAAETPAFAGIDYDALAGEGVILS